MFHKLNYAFFSVIFFSLVFSACMAAVKYRPDLHQCAVIFFLGIMACKPCMLFGYM